MTLAPSRPVKSNMRAWKAPRPNVSSGSQLTALTTCTPSVWSRRRMAAAEPQLERGHEHEGDQDGEQRGPRSRAEHEQHDGADDVRGDEDPACARQAPSAKRLQEEPHAPTLSPRERGRYQRVGVLDEVADHRVLQR